MLDQLLMSEDELNDSTSEILLTSEILDELLGDDDDFLNPDALDHCSNSGLLSHVTSSHSLAFQVKHAYIPYTQEQHRRRLPDKRLRRSVHLKKCHSLLNREIIKKWRVS